MKRLDEYPIFRTILFACFGLGAGLTIVATYQHNHDTRTTSDTRYTIATIVWKYNNGNPVGKDLEFTINGQTYKVGCSESWCDDEMADSKYLVRVFVDDPKIIDVLWTNKLPAYGAYSVTAPAEGWKEIPDLKWVSEDNGSPPALYKNETLHHFSSTTEKDQFRITVTGPSIRDGQFRFQIINSTGQLILDETFSTLMLLDYGFKGKVDDPEAEQYMEARLDSFFVENHFHEPAIPEDDEFDGDYSKKEIWDDIISDQTAVGFYYLVGKEDARFIAFSKKQGKVVMYYNCC